MKYYIILLINVFCFSCAGPRLFVVDPAGRQIPIPHYVLFSTSDLNIQTVFYWSKNKSKQDLDGMYLSYPQYLDISKTYTFSRRDITSISVTIEIGNPKEVCYELYQNIRIIDTKKSNITYTRKSIGKSNTQYRQFVVYLPFDKKTNTVSCEFSVVSCSDSSEVMRLGNFKYNILN